MELYLNVFLRADNSFRVYRNIAPIGNLSNSVLKLDYNYTPWPRYRGNLLWS